MKSGKAIATALLFSAGTAGLFAADMYVGDLKQERLERCDAANEGSAREACIETVNDHYNVGGAIDILEFAGVIAIIGAGYEVYKRIADERENTYSSQDSPATA